MAVLSVLSFAFRTEGVASTLEFPREVLVEGLQLATIVVFLRWLHLAVRHAQAMGRRVTGSPRAAALWWFVPVANFIVPFERIRRLAPEVPTRGWQACWVLSLTLPVLATRSTTTDGIGKLMAFGFLILSLAATVAAAVLGAQVVKGVTASLTPTRQ